MSALPELQQQLGLQQLAGSGALEAAGKRPPQCMSTRSLWQTSGYLIDHAAGFDATALGKVLGATAPHMAQAQNSSASLAGGIASALHGKVQQLCDDSTTPYQRASLVLDSQELCVAAVLLPVYLVLAAAARLLAAGAWAAVVALLLDVYSAFNNGDLAEPDPLRDTQMAQLSQELGRAVEVALQHDIIQRDLLPPGEALAGADARRLESAVSLCGGGGVIEAGKQEAGREELKDCVFRALMGVPKDGRRSVKLEGEFVKSGTVVQQALCHAHRSYNTQSRYLEATLLGSSLEAVLYSSPEDKLAARGKTLESSVVGVLDFALPCYMRDAAAALQPIRAPFSIQPGLMNMRLAMDAMLALPKDHELPEDRVMYVASRITQAYQIAWDTLRAVHFLGFASSTSEHQAWLQDWRRTLEGREGQEHIEVKLDEALTKKKWGIFRRN